MNFKHFLFSPTQVNAIEKQKRTPENKKEKNKHVAMQASMVYILLRKRTTGGNMQSCMGACKKRRICDVLLFLYLQFLVAHCYLLLFFIMA